MVDNALESYHPGKTCATAPDRRMGGERPRAKRLGQAPRYGLKSAEHLAKRAVAHADTVEFFPRGEPRVSAGSGDGRQRTRSESAPERGLLTVPATMRVDNVPPHILPFFHLYGYGVGALLEASTLLMRRTCRFSREQMSERDGPRIECLFHEHLPVYFASYLPPPVGERYAWLNHPIWYMRAVHVLLAWNGVHKLALGSTGHGGQNALAQVIAFVRAGYNTTFAVDGPAGPPHVVRRGALDVALATGRPLVALRFTYDGAFRQGGWDRKWQPLPFSRVRIYESPPLFVTADNYEEQKAQLTRELTGARHLAVHGPERSA